MTEEDKKTDTAPAAPAAEAPAAAAASSSAPGGFGMRLHELTQLVGERGTNGMERLASHGGVTGVASKLKTDLTKGICANSPEELEADLESRRHVFGRNKLPEMRIKNIFELIWEATQDPILIILMIAGIISIVLGIVVECNPETGWIEGVAILVSVVIVVMVTAVNDLQKEKQFQALKRQQETTRTADVIRNGETVRVDVSNIVVGDLLMLNLGALLPADGVLVRGNNLATDESALTGEPLDIKKDSEKDPWLLSGTSLKQGDGVVLITSVGLFSEEGIIQKLVTKLGGEESARLEALSREGLSAEQLASIDSTDNSAAAKAKTAAEEPAAEGEGEGEGAEEDDKPMSEEQEAKKNKEKKAKSLLQAKLTRMALLIGYAGFFMAVLTVIVLLLEFTIGQFAIKGREWQPSDGSTMLEFLIIGITVLVVAVPEGLPLAVTISLAYSVGQMQKDNNLVRVLAACETMGNATTICSDKTGTLTKNRMTVVRAWLMGEHLEDVADAKNAPEDVKEALCRGIALNSGADSQYVPSEKEGEFPKQHGSKTDCAILQFGDLVRENKKTFRDYRAETPAEDFTKVYPFSSKKKRMCTIVPKPEGGFRCFVKGASEIVLGMAATRLDKTGAAVPLSADEKAELEKSVIEVYASEALRVIALAYKDYESEADWENEEDIYSDLILIGFVGIIDPVRDEVPEAIETCKAAGVTVRMVTGDNVATARAIALKCKIISPDDDFLVMEGPEFRRRVVKADGELDYDEINRIWPRLRVMGRCSPSDKYNLVKGLINAKEVVAVTGDGTNDGPALSMADVGFSMGITGTDVAKEASDIVLLDDSFLSIVKAISWGRNVYDSISKFLVFQLTVNVVAVTVAFIGACTIQESPLRAVQMLWVNLIMDSFAALALATEKPTPELLERKPYGRNQSLISKVMWRQIFGHSIYQIVILFLILYYGDTMWNIPSGRPSTDDANSTDADHHDSHGGLDNHTSNTSNSTGGCVKHETPDPTMHYTMVFNVFVLMQLFNELNARVINDKLIWEPAFLPASVTSSPFWKPIGALYRPVAGVFTNWIFVGVMVFTLIAQVLIVEYGGKAVEVSGLTADLWGWSVLIGFGSMPWNVVLHYFFPPSLIPDRLVSGTRDDIAMEQDAAEEEADPLAVKRMKAGVVWQRIGNNLRLQIRVANAFRSTNAISELKRRTSQAATMGIEYSGNAEVQGEETLLTSTPVDTVLQVEGEEHQDFGTSEALRDRSTSWSRAIGRVRFQLRVASAFRDGVTSRLAVEDMPRERAGSYATKGSLSARAASASVANSDIAAAAARASANFHASISTPPTSTSTTGTLLPSSTSAPPAAAPADVVTPPMSPTSTLKRNIRIKTTVL